MRALAASLLTMLAAGPAEAVAPFDPFGAASVIERPGTRVPLDLPLRDAMGRPTTLRAVAAGRPLVLAPVLHDCPNICGVTLAGLSQAIAGQPLKPGRDFTVVAFGIDPQETPQAAARDLARLQGQPAGRAFSDAAALVGPEASIAATTRALGYRYAWDPRIGQYAHVAAVAVLTRDGRLIRWLYGLTPRPAELQHAVADAAAGRTGGITEKLQLLCYHYDPESGRYTLAVERLVRTAGLLTVAAMLFAVRRLRKGFG